MARALCGGGGADGGCDDEDCAVDGDGGDAGGGDDAGEVAAEVDDDGDDDGAACGAAGAADFAPVDGMSLTTTFVGSGSCGSNCSAPIAITPITAAAASGVHQRQGRVASRPGPIFSGALLTARCAAARIAASSAGGGISVDCARHAASSGS